MLFTVEGCARLRTGLIITQIPRGYQKKVYCVQKRDMCDPLRKKPIFAFPEAKKGVVHCGRLRKAAHWPNNNANPSGLSEKQFIAYKSAICAIRSEKTPFLAFPENKKGVVHCARLCKAVHWPNKNANPSGLSEKKVYSVKKRDMCDP